MEGRLKMARRKDRRCSKRKENKDFALCVVEADERRRKRRYVWARGKLRVMESVGGRFERAVLGRTLKRRKFLSYGRGTCFLVTSR